MPWDLPIAVLTGFANPVTDWVISTNQTDLNLYDYTGNQPEVLEYNVTVNPGVDINTMELGGFPAGCIINFTLLGRIRGRGGAGGEGAWAEGNLDLPEANPWSLGNGIGPEDAEDALVLAPSVTFRLDADSGNIWGGGGGGGGGRSIIDNDGVAAGGGGGGGGRGWNTSPGGVAGVVTGFASDAGNDGTDGTSSAVGLGGSAGSAPGPTSGSPGGNGGDWGNAGGTEAFPPSSGNPNGTYGVSGAIVPGGAAGKAIELNGATLQYVGVKGEATLISEGRLRGAVS